MFDVLNFDRTELTGKLDELYSETRYRAEQLFRWVYRERHCGFDAMTDIAKELRAKLANDFVVSRPTVTSQLSKDGTRKFLFSLADGKQIETVLICQPKRYTLCVSSQTGCAIGCTFCKTATMGLIRHLETSEILGQVLAVKDFIAEHNIDFANIVFMGMGEPLHNYENLLRSVKILIDPKGLNFSPKKVTVSTSGLVPEINKLAESGTRVNLAISLNATTDELRREIMPIGKRYPIEELLTAGANYAEIIGRPITIEYVLFAGLNDSAADINRLAKLLHKVPSLVNIIPYNSNTGLEFKKPSSESVYNWQQSLLERGLNARIRWSKGEDISAACGQLVSESTR